MIFAVSYVPRTPPRHPNQHHPRQVTPQRVYWARRIAALLIAVLVVALLARACGGGEPEPAPEAVEETTTETTPKREATASIPDARPVEMVIPVIGLRAGFDEADCRVVDGAIDPKSMDKACAYTAPDKPYALPGTDSPDVVVVAGHTGAGVNAVFNSLYDGANERHTVHEGDSLYIRTEASGEDWLKYTATDLHDPEKTALSDDPDVWGTGPTPGRLLTISCIQPANLLAESVRNAVVGWQFAGTVTDVAVERAFEPR